MYYHRVVRFYNIHQRVFTVRWYCGSFAVRIEAVLDIEIFSGSNNGSVIAFVGDLYIDFSILILAVAKLDKIFAFQHKF